MHRIRSTPREYKGILILNVLCSPLLTEKRIKIKGVEDYARGQ